MKSRILVLAILMIGWGQATVPNPNPVDPTAHNSGNPAAEVESPGQAKEFPKFIIEEFGDEIGTDLMERCGFI